MRRFTPGLKHPFGSNQTKGQVYFIQVGADGPIKIGFSSDVAQRLRTLQTGHTEKLRLLHKQVGTKEDEAALHRKFRNIHIKGEWYEADAVLVEFIRKRKSP